MTTPAQPDTGAAGAAPDTGTAPETGTTGQDAATATETVDWQAEAEKYKALARKHEQRAKENKAKLDDLQAKAQPAEGEEDWKAKYEAEQARASEAEIRAVELAYQTTVTRIAGTVGADAEALLDSQSFRDKVAEELDDDFDDDDLKAAVSKVAKGFAKKPRYAAQRPGGASGGDFTGSPGAAASIDQQIADAEKNRDFATAIALKRQRAALTR